MRRAFVMAAICAMAAIGVAMPAAAAQSAYATWSVYGANPHWTGTAHIPIAGFPDATWQSSAENAQVGSGKSTYLTAATPFGALYGSSQNAEYLSVQTAEYGAPSVTTITFDSSTPTANWGFVLGDIDADQVKVAATDAQGNLVPGKDMGFQGVFNYCATNPRPPVCGGSQLAAAELTETATWNPTSGTLAGKGSGMTGASAWFQPSARLKTLTFTFAVRSTNFAARQGNPAYKIWLAAKTVDNTGLPNTGSPTKTLAAVAITLILGGAALRLVLRRA